MFKKASPNKIFCVSFQRNGTTSTGNFFSDHGFKTAGYPVSKMNHWTLEWFKGNYEAIFNSKDFKRNSVFEDDPWWCGDFYKYLFNRFPDSKFILIERNPNNWFDSMLKHSSGKSIGNTFLHASLYNRLLDLDSSMMENAYTNVVDRKLLINPDLKEEYQKIYLSHNLAVKCFFETQDPTRLFIGKLEDKDLWIKMGEYFGINVQSDYKSHENASNFRTY